MKKFNAYQYNRLIAGVKTFQRIIAPLAHADRDVVNASPSKYRAALVAAAAVANCSGPLLSLVIFGETLKGCTRCGIGRWGREGAFEGCTPQTRFDAYADPAALVAATCGPCPDSVADVADLSASLF